MEYWENQRVLKIRLQEGWGGGGGIEKGWGHVLGAKGIETIMNIKEYNAMYRYRED